MQKIISKKPLLVTGSHRSGSTWIGKVIESSNDFHYLEEPTSFNDIPGSLDSIEYWFQYIQPQDEEKVKALQQLKEDAEKEDKRALFKDPLAFFSIDTFIKELNSDVLLSVRHPAAFVSSLKRLGWGHDFNHFLEQEALMDTYLYPFRDQIRDFAHSEKELIEQGILLWNIINLNALKFKQKYPEIYIVKHEDLSLQPMENFEKIFSYFHIPFEEPSKAYIRKTTSKTNTAEAQNNVEHQLNRDSKANIYNFHKRLTKEEIVKIQKGTEFISHIFYEPSSWSQ